MTVTTERPADDGIVRAPNDLDYDPADIDALGDYMMSAEATDRQQMTFESRPCRFVSFSLSKQMGGSSEFRLTASEARTLAGTLIKAADNLDAGRGTV